MFVVQCCGAVDVAVCAGRHLIHAWCAVLCGLCCFDADSLCVLCVAGVLFSYCLGQFNSVQCDPADGSAPLLTTLSDLLGIAALCGLSVLFLG